MKAWRTFLYQFFNLLSNGNTLENLHFFLLEEFLSFFSEQGKYYFVEHFRIIACM